MTAIQDIPDHMIELDIAAAVRMLRAVGSRRPTKAEREIIEIGQQAVEERGRRAELYAEGPR